MKNTGVRGVIGSGYSEPQNRQHEEKGYLGNSRAFVLGGMQVQMGEQREEREVDRGGP